MSNSIKDRKIQFCGGNSTYGRMSGSEGVCLLHASNLVIISDGMDLIVPGSSFLFCFVCSFSFLRFFMFFVYLFVLFSRFSFFFLFVFFFFEDDC